MFKVVKTKEWLSVNTEGVCVLTSSGEEVKPYIDKDGYQRIIKSIEGKVQRCAVHRAVCLAFLDNPEDKPQVNHLNSIRDDNRLENLEWCTPKENSAHGVAYGNITGAPLGEGNGANIYEESVIHTICKLLSEGYRNVDISKKLGVHRTLPSDIRNRVSWEHISKDYTFEQKRARTISPTTAENICMMLAKGETIRSISKQVGYSVNSISSIKNRKTYTSISKNYQW